MFRKVFVCLSILCFFSITIDAKADNDHMVEVFDIKRSQVIISVHINQAVQNDVEIFLEGIDGIVKQINPIPNEGIIIKVPLEPNIMIENEWIHGLVDQVMIIYPENNYPYLLVFDEENSPHFFTFHGEALGLLLKVL